MNKFYDLELENKEDFVMAMKRIYAWYDGEMLDRCPVRFAAHNEQFNVKDETRTWGNIKEKWYDVEYQVESFIKNMPKEYIGETFPMFDPNLGPNVFAAMLGGTLKFGDVTTWVEPIIISPDEINKIEYSVESEYYKKLVELTDYALERCDHKFMVNYTDVHPSLDCVDALRGTVDLCMDMYDDEDFVLEQVQKCYDPFIPFMDDFHKRLKAKKQLSSSWMHIPSYTSMHIPSCDLSAMMSREFFGKFALPSIAKEIEHFDHNIFHLDGKGVANHIDDILELPKINAIQWAQGVGNDLPIMQWVDFIKKIQASGKGVLVDLTLNELEPFMSEVSPKGIFMCISESDTEIQKEVIKKLEKWK